MKISSKIKITFIIVLLFFFFLFLNLTNFSKNIKNAFFLISEPIQRVFWLTGDQVSIFFEAIFQASQLKEENKRLELKIQELNTQIIELKEIEKENIILRQALGLGLQKEFQMILAQITAKPTAQDLILINKGLKDGIAKNMPAITQEKILIGRVIAVYPNFSKIMLLSSRESIVPVKIQGMVEATIRGMGNLEIRIDHLPLDAQISSGNLVVTSNLGGLFPSGLLIGSVKDVERLGVELFQQASLQPAINPKEVRDIFIITNF